jgi:hypothetical protein
MTDFTIKGKYSFYATFFARIVGVVCFAKTGRRGRGCTRRTANSVHDSYLLLVFVCGEVGGKKEEMMELTQTDCNSDVL